MILPHRPWDYVGTGQDYGPETMHGLYFDSWTNDWTAARRRQRHLIQVQAADRLLGEVMAKLHRIGAYDKSLVVVTTDHGMAFTKGQPLRGVSEQNYPQIMWTPLFVKTPGQTTGAIDDRVVESIDIVPTIADILDQKLPWRVDGRSMLGQPRPNGRRPILDWETNTIPPVPGTIFAAVDGRSGFTRALASRVFDATGRPDLRLYSIGAHQDLVGRLAAPLTLDRTVDLHAALDEPGHFRGVAPDAHHAPWAFVTGKIDCPPFVPLAITVNGRVASLAETYQIPFTDPNDGCTFWTDLPPQLFRAGDNDIGISVIETGADGVQRLRKVRLGNG